jgi:hypothetical protein
MRFCIFCDGLASTKEDVWPKWLMKQIGGSKTGRIKAERIGLAPRSWNAGHHTIKFVCAHCNNGWMSQLEDRVKPIVMALFGDGPVILDNNDQVILAVWSIKNAMVFEALRSTRLWFFDETERRNLRETQQPTPRISVWIAKCVDNKGIFCSGIDLKGDTVPNAENLKAYVTTMGFGPLGIQVVSIKTPDTIAQNINITTDLRPGPWDRISIRIWPLQQDRVIWPASMGLSGDLGLTKFSERWNPITP